jgi:5-methylcytosine-specific restriction endonuclease McrA
MIRRPVRPSLKPIPRYTPLRPFGIGAIERRERYKKFLASATWRRIRKAALERAGYQCEQCGAHGPGVRLEVDHIRYTRFGGDELPEDLRVLCVKPCHRAKHGRKGWQPRSG